MVANALHLCAITNNYNQSACLDRQVLVLNVMLCWLIMTRSRHQTHRLHKLCRYCTGVLQGISEARKLPPQAATVHHEPHEIYVL